MSTRAVHAVHVVVGMMMVASGIVLGACGGDDDGGSASTAPPPAATTADATATTTADASSETAAGAPTTPAAEPDVVATTAPTASAGGGTSRCAVTITGDVAAEWTSDVSGPTAFVYGGWLANPSAEDAGTFALNCYDDDFNIVGFSSRLDATVPMEPATYQLSGSVDPASPMTVEVALLFDDGLWETTGGTLDIVRFDESHIEGTFSLQIQDSFDPTRTAEVTGEFAHSR